MNTFTPLLIKEVSGLWKSKKYIWLPIVFMLLSAMQPLTLYFMEDILKMGGSLPEGAVFKMPVPTSGEVLASVLSQLNTLGVLLVVVTVMGAISDERKNGSLTFVLVRPVSSFQIVASKFVSHGLLLIFSFVCGYLLAYYYTVVLFAPIPLSQIVESMLLYCLYILFIVACVMCCSAILNSNGTIAIITILFLGGLSIISGWFSEALQWSPTQLSNYAVTIVTETGRNEGIIGCISVTIILILVLYLTASYFVKRKPV